LPNEACFEIENFMMPDPSSAMSFALSSKRLVLRELIPPADGLRAEHVGRFQQAGFDRCLRPRFAVVAAGHRAPGLSGLIAVVAAEPQGHQADFRDAEDIGDLHRAHGECWRGDECEGDAIAAAVEIVVPLIFADAAHPEQHRARGIEPFADRDLAVVLRGGDHGLRRPGFATVGRGARINGAIITGDGVAFATAINAHQFAADGLEHRPRVVARHILHKVGLWQSFQRRHFHRSETRGLDEGVARIARLPLNAHGERCVRHDFVM
jgi:hypothetical protein